MVCWLQRLRFVYVDSTPTMAAIIYTALLATERVLEDGTHVMRRIMRVIQPGHPCNRETLTAVCVSTLCVRLQLSVCAFFVQAPCQLCVRWQHRQ